MKELNIAAPSRIHRCNTKCISFHAMISSVVILITIEYNAPQSKFFCYVSVVHIVISWGWYTSIISCPCMSFPLNCVHILEYNISDMIWQHSLFHTQTRITNPGIFHLWSNLHSPMENKHFMVLLVSSYLLK